jgi:hypothetical protein
MERVPEKVRYGQDQRNLDSKALSVAQLYNLYYFLNFNYIFQVVYPHATWLLMCSGCIELGAANF